jgi:hypothetical protein
MDKTLMGKTPAEIAAIKARRQATAAARRAKKTGQPTGQTTSTGQPGQAPRVNPFGQPTARRTRRNRYSYGVPTPRPAPVASAPIFSTPKPNTRALKLVALVALEAAFTQKCIDAGGIKNCSDDIRNAFTKYTKIKTLALGAAINVQTQNEADTALRFATIELLKLCY